MMPKDNLSHLVAVILLSSSALTFCHSFQLISSRVFHYGNVRLAPPMSLFYPPTVRSFFESPCILDITRKASDDDKAEGDSFSDEEFDPLRSPHTYSRDTASRENGTPVSGREFDDDWSPLKMKGVKKDFSGSIERDYQSTNSQFTMDWSLSPNSAQSSSSSPGYNNNNKEVNDSDFDPLLSPHAYPNGTSEKPVLANDGPSSSPRVGVLLIDHGSVRSSSNERLEKIAALYQSRVAQSNIIVKAVHMEIATPSIKDGIKELFTNQHVVKIVCHPYFLSPGRHVSEDVPDLIHNAVAEINMEMGGGKNIISSDMSESTSGEKGSSLFLGHGKDLVEVVMTDHVGSNLDRMVDIMEEMVDESLGQHNIAQGSSTKEDKACMGGFFGNVQKMLDEQI